MHTPLVPSATAPEPATEALRAEVRAFLHDRIDAGSFTPGVDTWLTRWDPAFTRALAERGWVGMTIPVEYGGHGRTFMERFVVTEELLAVGAPVAAQWVADRQAAPSLLKFGTEEQKQRFLPRIARGEICWAIGMSEPESGSDLASVRTKAVRVDGGWSITGTKLWTSGAHHADAFFALARSAPLDTAHRHAGLSQFIVLLDSPGVTIRPILSMSGDHHFNEVQLDGVFVPDDLVLGTIGEGWAQVTSELGFERSGPERFLSTFTLLAATIDEIATGRIPADARVGALVGRLVGLHHMSTAVSEALERRENADVAASVVKVLGTATEGDIADLADELGGESASPEYAALVAAGAMQRPGFTLRGGTSEILRGVIARGLGMR
ncbi:acyl-CoA dehydrogenase family protein [Rhodococcus sp. NPDC003318]|uniref:acyl-CoA dehydrogenase family protein n=1 Tax=Rhodococcus sp. NPDC003318 TaxID=3364503 RepID=UPI0036949597